MRRLLAVALVLGGCSHRASTNDTSDAAVAPIATTSAVLSRVPEVAHYLREAQPLLAHDGALRPRLDEAATLDVAIPTTARAALRIAPHDRTGAWLAITATDVDDVPLAVDGRLAVGRNALPATDVTFVAGSWFAEDTRVLRTAAAPTTARWSIEHGPDVALVRARDARIEAVDGRGVLVLGTPPVVAIDARGERRTANVRVTREGDRFVVVASLNVEGLVHPITLDPAWSTAGSPLAVPQDLAATVLTSGKVLRMGGLGVGVTVSTAEIYDPTTNTWTTARSAAVPRRYHHLVALPSGKALVAGGDDLTNFHTTAEIYDPATDTWSAAASLPGYIGGSAIVLPSGKVLVGSAESSLLYDPAANSWTPVTSTATGGGRMVLLSTGKVLAVGGWIDDRPAPLGHAALYDPATNTWTNTGSLSTARMQHDLAVLPSGKVLAAGGEFYRSSEGYTYHSSAEIYNPSTGTWSAADPLTSVASLIGVAKLANGRVLAVADGMSTVEVYDEPTNNWLRVSSTSGYRPKIVALADGSALVLGGAGARRFKLMANGAPCSATYPAECLSGLCVDGVCCNAACTASCSACDVTGSVGTCAPVTGPTHGARSCGVFACKAGVCATTCSVDAECAPGRYCSGGTCLAQKTNSTSCGRSGECTSGFCTDGVCCNAACGGQCEACSVFGSVGTCTPVTGTPRGTRPVCTGSGIGTECGISCNGSNRTACTYPDATITCSKNECKDGVETHANTCNSAGACSDTPKTCGAFACGTTTCKTSCTVNTDCASGHYCAGGVCNPVAGLGDACTSAGSCSGGLFCTDGVCCGVTTCGAGKSCAGASKKGVCSKIGGTSCTANAECGSGFCVDSVCCDRACDGQCEACDVTGKNGTCTPISGDPHGARAKCNDGGGDKCKALTCDGAKDAKACSAYAAGPTVACSAATCSGSTLVPESRCDGAGSCAPSTSVSCAPYVCAGTKCLTSCIVPGDCASGFVCRDGACVSAPKPVCEPDGVSSRAPDGTITSCGDFLCGTNGECLKECGTSADCAPGRVCDPARKLCSAGAGDSGDDGGCAYGGRSSAGAWALLALFVALRSASRRRGLSA